MNPKYDKVSDLTANAVAAIYARFKDRHPGAPVWVDVADGVCLGFCQVAGDWHVAYRGGTGVFPVVQCSLNVKMVVAPHYATLVAAMEGYLAENEPRADKAIEDLERFIRQDATRAAD